MISREWDWFMNISDSLKKLFFYRQHPEAALRYGPIMALLNQKHLSKSKILEVGSGSYGITPYLKRRVVGVDMNFSEPEFTLLKQVKGSALDLPFPKKHFEVVILSDVLEHLSKKDRPRAVEEAVRVAKEAVVISGPFGEEAAKQDKELAELSLKRTGRMHPFFEDHLKYGLPEVSGIKNSLKSMKRVKEVKIVGEYLNLGVRKKLMNFFLTENKLVYYFYLKGLMPIVPFLRYLNKPPCYRTVIFVRCDK